MPDLVLFSLDMVCTLSNLCQLIPSNRNKYDIILFCTFFWKETFTHEGSWTLFLCPILFSASSLLK